MLSSPDLDAAKIAPARVLVGSFFGAIHPVVVRFRDVNGDRKVDLEARFSTRAYQELQALSEMKTGFVIGDASNLDGGALGVEDTKEVELLAAARKIGLHYWGPDGMPWLVDDILTLGKPIVLPPDDVVVDPERLPIPTLVTTGASAGPSQQTDPAAPEAESAPSALPYFMLSAPGHVQVDVYNLAGRRMATVVSGYLEAGRHELSWNGRDATGGVAARGVYLYRIESPDGVAVRKTVLWR